MAEPLRITSRQNQRIKEAVRLRTGRERQRRGLFLIDGAREIARAIQLGARCVEAFIRDEAIETSELQCVLQAVQSTRANVSYVVPEVFEKLAFGDRDDGIVVVAEAPRRELSDLSLPPNPLVAVVEGVEKPGNVGAILRSADAAGIDAVIIASGGTDLYNPNTIRASLGTVFRDNVCEATTAETLDWLRLNGVAIVAARPDAEVSYTDVDFRRGTAIVLGSEAHGLSDAWQGQNITAIQLPMRGIADSLNVSTTAAILFYEALRQRMGSRS